MYVVYFDGTAKTASVWRLNLNQIFVFVSFLFINFCGFNVRKFVMKLMHFFNHSLALSFT